MSQFTEAKANVRGPTNGFTDIDDDSAALPSGINRLTAKIFTPLQVGSFNLSHRVIHAALGRSRSARGEDSPLAAQYFAARTTPGGLIISQATGVQREWEAWPFSLELHTEAQISALARTIAVVHDKGGIWFQQLFHVGRSSSPGLVRRAHERAGVPEPSFGYRPVSSWTIEETGINTHSGEPFGQPHALTIDEIKNLKAGFKATAENAKRAGADGIEVLSANGFLLDQFLHDNINQRSDQYGGTVENRSRLVLEVIDAVAEVFDYQKIGIRLSPFSNFHQTDGSNPVQQVLHLSEELVKRGIAYLHVGEARVSRDLGYEANLQRLLGKGIAAEDISLAPWQRLLGRVKPTNLNHHKTVLFGAGGYTSVSAVVTVEQDVADAVVFGRHFIANPDIVRRLRFGYPLSQHDRTTFYTHGANGFITYREYDGPIAEEEGRELRSLSDGPGIIPKLSHLVDEQDIPSGESTVNMSVTDASSGDPTNGDSPRHRVAIVGAGVSGILTANAFNRLPGYDLQIFERRAVPGGVWVYDAVSTTVPVFPAADPGVVNPPLARPKGTLPGNFPRSKQQRWISTPLYEKLHTNIPYQVMGGGSAFTLPTPDLGTSPYLPGAQVTERITEIAHTFDDIISYSTTVENVDKLQNGKLRLLLRRENADETDYWFEEDFDHLVVATGHGSVPRVPDIPGLGSWEGGLRHTATWRSAEEFKGQRILVVGNSESAIDVVLQSVPHANGPVYVSERTPHPRYPTVMVREGVKVLPTIDHFTGKEVHFTNGVVLSDVDVVVFATGYFFTYPFLSEEVRPRSGGFYIPGLFQHVFDMHNPKTIAFIGAVSGSLSWSTWEKTAFVTALYWLGKISLPPIEEQRTWETDRLREIGETKFHILSRPWERFLYSEEINELAADYLRSPALDDELLRPYPGEWLIHLLEGLGIKKKFYGIAD